MPADATGFAPVAAVAPAPAGPDSGVAAARAGLTVAGLTPQLLTAAAEAGLGAEVLTLGLRAHERVRDAGLTDRSLVTIVDFSRLSREPRLWVVDVATGEILARELVAHGRNSGGDQADRFSNRSGSYQSSLGTFVTGSTYTGKHGRSLRLRGLDEGLNDNAFARAIVIHGADYVNEGIVKQLGRLGRSQGCPALSPAAAARVIDLIRDGTTFFAYYPSPELAATFPEAPELAAR
jgi:hypothetical protein